MLVGNGVCEDVCTELYTEIANRRLNAVPVGVAPWGYRIIKSDATVEYISKRFAETYLTTAGATSDTTIQVASIADMATGDQILIGLDTGATHSTTINGAPSGTTVTLTAALPSGAALGRAVKSGAWASITL